MPVYQLKFLAKLAETARQLRVQSLKMIHKRQAGYPGGSLSCAEIIALLIFHIMKLDPKNPGWEERDRFVLSKSHAAPVLYAALAWRGFFPFSELENWGKIDSMLQARPDHLRTPGVDISAGTSGHGLAMAAGMALAIRSKKLEQRVFTLLGDGECQTGLVWETAQLAARFKLSNLTAIVDMNRIQADGQIKEILPIEPFNEKWRACNWNVFEADGHSIAELLQAFDSARSTQNGPSVIIAHTTKGKGVGFMENNPAWHSTIPDDHQLALALHDLEREKIK